MRQQADAEGFSNIGVGYCELSWKKVRAIVEGATASWRGTLVDYEEFVPGDVVRP
jgi:hypothetical protein